MIFTQCNSIRVVICILSYVQFFADPLYNSGAGFSYPGQFPNFNDPFDMFKQIQAQIEAQHRA